MHRLARGLCLNLGVLAALACGAKTGLDAAGGARRLPPADPYQDALGASCAADADCPARDACFPLGCTGGVCIEAPPVVCEDDDPCTVNFCDPVDAACSYPPSTPDHDADGHRAPLPGFAPGAPGSCGDDCDDTRAAAFPGGREICDGADNDCNGVVDDGFTYSVAPGQTSVIVATGEDAGVGGLAFDGERYGLSTSYTLDHAQNQFLSLASDGDIVAAQDIALTNSDSNSGPLLWTGNAFASVWEDRRDEDYEIYFNRFDVLGNKLGPDLRVSVAPEFSLQPTLDFTGQEYVSLWGDRRSGGFQIFGQRLDVNGLLLSTENVNLTPEIQGAAAPSLAIGTTNMGFAFNVQSDENRTSFRIVDHDFGNLGPIVRVSDPNTVGAGVSFINDSYLVTWGEYDDFPGDAIWGSVLSTDGLTLIEPRRLTEPAPFARSYTLLNLGDRLMLFWGQWADDSFDIFSRLITPDLEPLTPAVRITTTTGDAVGPAVALGNDGELGLTYSVLGAPVPQAHFMTLQCGL